MSFLDGFGGGGGGATYVPVDNGRSYDDRDVEEAIRERDRMIADLRRKLRESNDLGCSWYDTVDDLMGQYDIPKDVVNAFFFKHLEEREKK